MSHAQVLHCRTPIGARRAGLVRPAELHKTLRAWALDRHVTSIGVSSQVVGGNTSPRGWLREALGITSDSRLPTSSPASPGPSQQGAQIRMHQDEQDGVPSRLSVAPCSDPSRRGLATPKREAKQVRGPALTAPCARRLSSSAVRDEGTASPARTKELHKIRSDR
jgi:hypothetical protein